MGKDILDIKVLNDGDKDAWKAEYNGHTILIINTPVKAILEIDGEEQAKSLSLTDTVLKGKLPEGESVVAFLESKMLDVEVSLFIGKEAKLQSGVLKKDKTFVSADEDGAYLTSIHLTE